MHNSLSDKRPVLALIAVPALALVLTACSAQPAAPATTAPSATQAPIATEAPTVAPLIQESPLEPPIAVSPLKPVVPQTYVPVSAEECEALRKSVADALKVDATTETAGFRDYASDVNGQGCLITLRGTGTQFAGGFVQVAQQLQALLEGQGWRYDQAYAADSPTGTLFGLRKNMQLVLVDVGWLASAGVNCPKDQPISACDIKPEQQNYTIMLNVAQGQ